MIDEEDINRKALQLIRDAISGIYDMIDGEHKEEERGNMLVILGEIDGIIRMAEELRKAADE